MSLTVKPYSEKVGEFMKELFNGNIEYYIQRWEYSGEMEINQFFQEFRKPEHVQEILDTRVQRVIYDNWGDNVDSWTLYNLTKERFYWDDFGFCVFNLFKFAYSLIQGSFEGYWFEADEVSWLFLVSIGFSPNDDVTYYSTIWGGAAPHEPLTIHQKKLMEVPGYGFRNTDGYPEFSEVVNFYKELQKNPCEINNPPKEMFIEMPGTNWAENKDLYSLATKWFVDWEHPLFDRECGRGDLCFFQNHTQKTIILIALRESEFLIDRNDEEWQ